MKKFFSLLAAVVISVSAFAQWTKPVPASQEMKTDNETIQYLYNLEYGGFLLGANDWNTRASISSTKGYKIKIKENWTEYNDDGTPAEGATMDGLSICDSVETKSAWNEFDCQSYDQIWCDGAGRSGAGMFKLIALGDNKYKITTTNVEGDLPLCWAPYKGDVNHTKLYLLDLTQVDDNEEPFLDASKACTTWISITPEAYEAFLPLLATYNAAVALGDAIAAGKAEYPNLDFSAEEAVYNNTASTKEELDAATKSVKAKVADFKSKLATPENPADMTGQIVNNGFEEGNLNGWTNSGTSSTQAQSNKSFDNTQGNYYCEKWHDAAEFDMNQTLTGMPEGIYKLSAWVYDSESTARLYVNETKSVALNLSDHYSLYAPVVGTDTVKIGITFTGTGSSWCCCDEFTLMYYGNTLDSYKYWWNDIKNTLNTEMAELIGEETPYYRTAREQYIAALAKGDAATTKDEIVACAHELEEIAAVVKASISAYASLKTNVESIEEELNDKEGELIDVLRDFIAAEDVEAGKDAIDQFIDAGVPDSLLNNLTVAPKVLIATSGSSCFVDGVSLSLTTEEVEAYHTTLQALYQYCISNSLVEGQDCTGLLVNANFADSKGKGWTVGSLGTPGAWTGGFENYPVCESWHKTFDIFQEVKVPNGIYSVSLKGFVRRDSNAEIEAEVYMNDFATKFTDIQVGGLPIAEGIDGFNCYLTNGETGEWTTNPIFQKADGTPCGHTSPNDALDTTTDDLYAPNGMEGASVAFSAGRYVAKAYGLVENGVIKLGVRNSRNDDWVLWGDFRLTYEGKSVEALQSILPTFLADLYAYLDENSENMTTVELEKAQKVAEKAQVAIDDEDADEMFESLSEVNVALVNAKKNVAAVAEFNKYKEKVDVAYEQYVETATEEAKVAYEVFAGKADDLNDCTTEEVEVLTEEAKDVLSAIKIPNTYPTATAAEPVDFTQVILNPDYAEGNNDGWSGTAPSVNSDVYNAELYNKDSFDYYQEIKGLPAGYYVLGVKGFYRQGAAADDYAMYTAGVDTAYNAHLYISCGEAYNSTPIVPISAAAAPGTSETGISAPYTGDGCVEVEHDIWVPNTMTTASYWFDDATYGPKYNNITGIKVEGEKNTIKIGLKKNIHIANDWMLFDSWTLQYTGNEVPTAINTVDSSVAVSTVAIYTISGTRVNSMVKGINIVKMSDGSVRKVLVK